MARWVVVLFGISLGGWGRAAPQTTMGMITGGDCRDPDLSQNAQHLARELRVKLGDTLLWDDGVRVRLSPQPSVDADDLGRQLDAAETHFYNGEHHKAEVAILHALDEIRRFPPGPERWKLAVRAELLESQVIRRLGRVADADELFRHVLRLQPGFQLDPDYFMPSIRQRFDRLRKELQAQKRVRLEVKSVPAGADVLLDGVKLGTPPAALEVWPVDYEVIVGRDGQRSLPHMVAARKENTILVDLQFEGAIQLDRDPCFATRAGDERSRLAGALKIAALLGVDSMVVLHLVRSSTGPASLGAAVLDTQTGQKVRYGEIKLQGSRQEPAPGLGELATFVITGEFGQQLVAVDVASPARTGRPAAAAPAGVATPALPTSVPAPASTASAGPPWLPRGWHGSAVLGLGGGGVVVGLAGGALLVFGNASMAESNTYFQGGPPAERSVDQIAALRDAARLEQAVGVVGLAVGGAALAAGAALLLAVPGERISLAASPGGAGVQVRW